MFDSAYCTNPLRTPPRSSIITGQYPSTHGCPTIGTKLERTDRLSARSQVTPATR